jgi:outer membrane immunogenic protein
MKKFLLATTALGFALPGASAADLPVKARAPMAIPAPFSWGGWYVGVAGGATYLNGNLKWGKAFDTSPYQVDCIGGGTVGVPCSSVPKFGGIFGGQVGYNWQFGSLVLGAEGEFAGLFNTDRSLVYHDGTGVNAYGNAKSDALWSIRGRAGLAFDRTLAYATAGYASIRQEISITGDYSAGPSKKWIDALAVGAGIEHAFTNNLSLRLEGIYYAAKDGKHIQDCTYAGDCTYGKTFRANPSQLVVRVGVNYLFSGR